jgi:hypothetical protein
MLYIPTMECLPYVVEKKATPCSEMKWTVLPTRETHISHHWYLLLALPGRSGDRIPVGGEILHTRTARLWAYLASCTNGTGFLCRGWGDWSVALTTHSHMAPRLKKKSGSMPVLLWTSHTTHSFANVFIWNLVSNSSVGHHKATVQEHKTKLEVETSCQIMNIRKRVSCVWRKTSLCFWVLQQRQCFI